MWLLPAPAWFKHILLVRTKGLGVAKLQLKPSPAQAFDSPDVLVSFHVEKPYFQVGTIFYWRVALLHSYAEAWDSSLSNASSMFFVVWP